MSVSPESFSGHLHSFSVGERSYLINASTGQAFLLNQPDTTAHAVGVSPQDLLNYGYLDAADPLGEEMDAAPTGIGSVLLNVTHHCNLACDYCIMAMPDLKHFYQEERLSLTEEIGEAAIDFLAREGYRDQVSLTFFGGEPLLKFKLIEHIVEYAESKYPGRFDYQMITNGCLMQPHMVGFFKKHRFSFLWSLDGEAEVHDRLRHFKHGDGSVFADSFAALRMLKEAWPECDVGVNVTYFKQTLELPAAMRFFRDQGIDKLRMDRGLVPRESPHAVGLGETERVNGMLSEVAREYLNDLMKGGTLRLNPFVNYMRVISKRLPRFRACNSGLDYVTIAATGEIYSCYKLLGLSDCRLGDVRSGFNQDISRRVWQRLHVSKRPVCGNCWARFICAGGCAADNRHLNDSYFSPARENCAIFQYAVELSIHLYFTLMETAPDTLKQLLGNEHLSDSDCPLRQGDRLSIGDDGRVENRSTGGVYQLNDASLSILSLCDGGHSVAEIAAGLSDRYGLPVALSALDSREQLFRMAKAGLIAIPG